MTVQCDTTTITATGVGLRRIMDKAEAKFANTAKKMDAALLNLLEKKPFDTITVTDVCREAGVHRSTFYAHYTNTLDLLNEVRDATMREFYASFEHLPQVDAFENREYLDIYLKFVEDHKRLFKVFLQNISLFDGLGILEGFENDIEKMPKKTNSRKNNTERYRMLFTATGITSIVSFWLESGCKESRHELAEIILEITKEKYPAF